MLRKVQYTTADIFAYDANYFEVMKDILLQKYYVLSTLKFEKNKVSVLKIEYNNKIYCLKIIYSVPLKKSLSYFFRKSFSLSTLVNCNTLKNSGFTELVKVYASCEQKNKFSVIAKEFILMEYIDGNYLIEKKQNIVENFLIRLHSKKHTHGDANFQNFLLDKGGNLKVIDTKLNKFHFLNIGGHYDMFKFRDSFKYNETPYPYSKNIIYWYCKLRYYKKYLKQISTNNNEQELNAEIARQ